MHEHFNEYAGHSGRWQWLQEPYSGESAELEKPHDDSMILAFHIPEAPYSDELFSHLEKAFDVTHGVIATLEIFGVELAGLGIVGLGITVLGPIAAFAAGFLAQAHAYAEARAKIAKERMKWGFAEGVVAGADEKDWKFAKSLFWEGNAEFNDFDQDAGAIAQKSYNLGLAAGFVQGRKLSHTQKVFFWNSLKKEMTDGDRAWFANDSKQWGRRMWIDYYINMAAKFIKVYVAQD